MGSQDDAKEHLRIFSWSPVSQNRLLYADWALELLEIDQLIQIIQKQVIILAYFAK